MTANTWTTVTPVRWTDPGLPDRWVSMDRAADVLWGWFGFARWAVVDMLTHGDAIETAAGTFELLPAPGVVQ